MTEELSIQCSHLSIEGEDDDIVDLGGSTNNLVEKKIELSLVGKVQTTRAYNFGAMKNTMNQIWSLSKRAVFREIESGLFVIQFFHWKDKEKVMNGRPWCFDHNLLVLHELAAGVQPASVTLDTNPFWIRFYDLPFECRTTENVRMLAAKVGEVMEVEEDEIIWDKSMRARVLMKTLIPLRRTQKFKNRAGVILEARIKYERLPHFCFRCGRMGHTERDCQEEEEVSTEKTKRKWGPGLVASPRKGRALLEEEVSSIRKGQKSLSFQTKPRAGETKDGGGEVRMGKIKEKEKEVVEQEKEVTMEKVRARVDNIMVYASRPREEEDTTIHKHKAVAIEPVLEREHNGELSLSFSVGKGGDTEKSGDTVGGRGGRRWKKLARQTEKRGNQAEESEESGVVSGKRDRAVHMEVDGDYVPTKKFAIGADLNASLGIMHREEIALAVVGEDQPRRDQ
ncbi:uncharacterized protein [Spinacia oleracea]|uniref:CCHC-type domain-containing protein n=1 Tax=Spinacia oleracea TaxID=3562 RepID=A0A9R0IDH6_SPIOL|nr:uncharacterized protein LOC110785934 [Spinacia oleracea]